ncbi:MAG: CocE/NonD family hydrolase [Desulfobacterales bacterium]|nr:CocE/NonD family hydrolase [Desulfobacterales bacterium]
MANAKNYLKRMKKKSGNPLKPAGALWLATVVLILISASAFAAPATTTLGTRGTISQPNPAITNNANAEWTDYSRDPDYAGAVTLPLQFIDTREGGKLAVLVSVPADANDNPIQGRFPAILTQTAYRIDVGNLMGSIIPSQTTLIIGGQDKYMIRRGYVSVAVDVRGTGMSSGVTALLGAEEQAAYADAVDWITQQSWFDGNLGLAGTSYLGITSLLTAEQGNPAAKAVFAEVPMGDPYRGTVAPGGMLDATFINIWMTLTQNLSVANDPAIKQYPQYANQIEAATQDHIAANESWYLPTINNGLNGVVGTATDDGNFWAVRSPVEKAKDIRVPTFIVGGTNDIFQRCEPLLYEQMKNKVNAKLLVVPGAHIQAILDAQSDHDNAVSDGAPGSETLLLQWFDHYLKGMDTGAESMPNVTQYVEGYGRFGGQRYATATDWPHPKASPQRFYLRGDMSLSNGAPRFNERSHDIYEPKAPSVSIDVGDDGVKLSGSVTVNDGSDCSSSQVQWSLGMAGLVPRPCYSDNSKVEADQKALVYETTPSFSDLYVNGPMQADIWMSATKPQAAIAVRIDDVDPSGKATPISTGLQSAAFRAVDTSRSRYINGVMVQPWHPFTAASMQPLKPNEPVLVQVEIFPAAALIRAGHRLRIAISSSNQAEGVWPLPQQAKANGNVTTIYNDPKHPSSLVVPVVPARELK